MNTNRLPLVLVPQYFGSTVYDRRTSRYMPFDIESTALLRQLMVVPFSRIHTEWSDVEEPSRVRALEMFYENFNDRGFFTVDQRFAGEVLNIEPPIDHLTGPLAVHLEIVSACNLKCTHCFAGELPRIERRLNLEELDNLFAQMAAIGSFRLGLTGGEPLLRRDIFQIIDAATSHGLHPCVTTNGLLITEEIARGFGERDLVWLNVSLEGSTAPSNDRIRGEGTFDRVLEKLAILRDHSDFTLAFTITSANANEVEECAALAERVGASTAVFRPLYPVGMAQENLDLMPTFDQYAQALDELTSFSSAGNVSPRHLDPFSPAIREDRQATCHTNSGCGAGNLVCSISVSGDINPCSFLGSGFNTGNVRERTLAELWHSGPGFTSIRALSDDAFTGGCRARALAFNGSISSADPWVQAATEASDIRRSLPLMTIESSRAPR